MNPPSALQDLTSLSAVQKAALRKSNFKQLSDVILTPPSDISKRLRVSLSEAQLIIENVCKELANSSLRVSNIGESTADDKFTTGDAYLDGLIGGGIRTSMVWEVSGESAAGKTQLALQLALLVQVRPLLGGLSGSACYLTTHAKLSTKRLSQLITEHPLLSETVCSLSDIHTVAVPTVELLTHTLKVTFPSLLDELRKDSTRKPIRLIVIDSISALFHTAEKSSSSTLFERSKALTELSRIMHTIAAKDKIAFVVINDVTDVFEEAYFNNQGGTTGNDIIYRDQARWFNSAHSIPRENAKEAGLGLVWANQLNVRIMLSRTNRRRYLDDSISVKRRRVDKDLWANQLNVRIMLSRTNRRRYLDDSISVKRRRVDKDLSDSMAFHRAQEFDDDAEQAIALRRFSVIFSSVTKPSSIDFVVTKSGISAVPDDSVGASSTSTLRNNLPVISSLALNTHRSIPQIPIAQFSDDAEEHPSPSQQFVNARLAETTEASSPEKDDTDPRLEVIPSTFPEEVDELEDGGLYWEEFDELPLETMPEIDFDGLEKNNVEEDIEASQAP